MLLHDIQLYAISVISQWEGLVTGGLLVALLTIWERFAIKRQVSVASAAIVFLVGGFTGSSYEVWNNEYRERARLADRMVNGRANIENVVFTPQLDGSSQPGRIIFHVSKKIYHPIIYFIFSGTISNVRFAQTLINSSQNLIANNVFRIEFEFPELLPGVPYEITYNSSSDVNIIAIVPQFSDIQSPIQ